ncbi:hypothetical protein [Kineococcus sp. SYSU DK002]|uniref:hypothetical protein n=1 Tax=Kineococcus sp. SYSU DK002 TaxID=3383123 RepID=UPI003D7C8930
MTGDPLLWSWAVVEGDADLSPVAAREDDPTVAELVDRRLAVRLPVGRVHGRPPQ